MKKKYINTKIGSFIDFKGLEHKVVIATVSEVLEEINKDGFYVFHEIVRYSDNTDEDCLGGVKKNLKIGYAICNPEDSFNEIVGLKKATARAERSQPILWTSDISMINTEIAEAYMNTLLRYISNSPEKYIKGYTEAKLKYEKQQALKQDKSNFNDNQLNLHNLLKKLPKVEINSVLNVVKNLKTDR